jgi:hypothetical protein
MTTALIGKTIRRPGDDTTRVPIHIDESVREDLRNLLYEPWMRGIGRGRKAPSVICEGVGLTDEDAPRAENPP